MRLVASLVVLSIACLAATSARATPTSRLVYSRSSDAESCPDEQALHHEVAARVGYDPFFPWAARTIVAEIARREGVFVATVELVDEKGTSHGARELRAERSCDELLGAMALAIAIAIDPQSLSRPGASTSPPPPPPPPNQPAIEAPAPVPSVVDTTPAMPSLASTPEVPRDSMAFEASAGAVGSTGVAPGPSLGVALGGALRWPGFSVGLEGRIDAPASATAPGGGEVSSWLALGAITPCAYRGPVFGCAVLQAGSVQTSGSGVPDTRSESLAWLATGGRLGLLLHVSEDTLLRIRTDVVANLDRQTLRLNGGDAWLAPLVAGSLGADVVLHFR